MRLRLPTPGLVGSPHVHSSCLGPVSFAGMSSYLRLQAPRAFAQVFAHCRFVYKKKVDPPRAHGPKPSVIPHCVSPPPWWRRALRHPALFFRPQQPIFILFLLYVVYCIWLYTPLPPVRLSAWPSCYPAQYVYSCTPTSVWSLARSHLLSSIPFPYQDPDDSSIARSPSSRFRASGQLIQVQAQLIFGVL